MNSKILRQPGYLLFLS